MPFHNQNTFSECYCVINEELQDAPCYILENTQFLPSLEMAFVGQPCKMHKADAFELLYPCNELLAFHKNLQTSPDCELLSYEFVLLHLLIQ